MRRSHAIDILLENASDYRDKREIHALMESEVRQVNNAMITKLYQSAVNKGYVDFDKIPASQGDITKLDGYDTLIGSVKLLVELSSKSNVKIKELQIVENAIVNIRTYKSNFEKAFIVKHEFVMLQYNTLVYAVLESVSLLISSYVDYIKRVDKVEFTILKGKGISGNICIKNLDSFNMSVKSGDFNKATLHLLNKGKEGFLGATTLAYSAAIALITVSIVPVMRELIYYFYASKMTISEFLDQQTMFLEMNRVTLDSSRLPADEKNRLIKRQGEYIKELEELSDKIRVNSTLTDSKAKHELKQDSKEWTLDSLKSGNDSGGFTLL